jgi:restriction system protein
MALPDYQSFMLPVLKFAATRPNDEIPMRELLGSMAKQFNLSEEELHEMLPSGATTTFGSRVSWACTYLKKALILESPKRGHIRITPRGIEVLGKNPKTLNTASLRNFPEFVAFQDTKATKVGKEVTSNGYSAETPQEQIEGAYRQLRSALASELLEKVKDASPAFFERLVVELLVRMGYGGSLKDAGKAVGKSGDEGIDGIIKEDKLGLDTIYIQAKRWKDNAVGRPAIQQFAGALAGQGAHKGIFITASTFTEDARSFVSKVNSKIVLIDGEELATYMIDHGIGVATTVSYDVKRVDSDYFAEGEE